MKVICLAKEDVRSLSHCLHHGPRGIYTTATFRPNGPNSIYQQTGQRSGLRREKGIERRGKATAAITGSHGENRAFEAVDALAALALPSLCIDKANGEYPLPCPCRWFPATPWNFDGLPFRSRSSSHHRDHSPPIRSLGRNTPRMCSRTSKQ